MFPTKTPGWFATAPRLVFAGACLVFAVTGCGPKDHEAKVLAQLVDPESARFGKASVSADGSVVCGTVNAKNRMGGYTGEQSYMVFGEGVWFETADDTHGFDLASCCYGLITLKSGRPLEDLDRDLLKSCAVLTPRVEIPAG